VGYQVEVRFRLAAPLVVKKSNAAVSLIAYPVSYITGTGYSRNNTHIISDTEGTILARIS
jgi:hypothetical protein